MRKRRLSYRLVAGAAIGGLALSVLFVVVPRSFLTVAPGPAPDVSALITPAPEVTASSLPGVDAGVGGAGRGRLLVTTVLAASATPVELWKAATDREVDLVPRGSLVPPGMTDAAYTAWSDASMVESQFTAAREAWAYLGHAATLTADGARVFYVAAQSPADGRLEPGDIVVSWQVGWVREAAGLSEDFASGVRQASESLVGAGSEASITLAVIRDGIPTSVDFSFDSRDMALWPFLGIALGAEGLRAEPAIPVTFPPGGIGGPSGGLILSLGIIDLFTPGDLTGGRIVAGTGTIGEGGYVGNVGGIDKKVRGAASAGATVFLVPQGEYAEAVSAARLFGIEDLELIPVSTLQGAYQALASLTGKNGPDYNGADLPPVPASEAAWAAAER